MIEYVVKNDETGELEMKPISYLAGSKDSFPVGMVTPFAGANAPEGWLICDGSEVSMTQYKALYDVIGDLYGTATNPANFVLPDLRETTPVGVGIGKGAMHDAVTLGQFKDDQIQNVSNTSVAQNITNSSTWGFQGAVTAELNAKSRTFAQAGYRTGDTTHGKILGMNYIIKY